MARSWSRTRMGGWATAQSPILVTTITLKRLMKRGYQSALDYYRKISPQFNEPLITRPVRSVVWEALPVGDADGAAYSITCCTIFHCHHGRLFWNNHSSAISFMVVNDYHVSINAILQIVSSNCQRVDAYWEFWIDRFWNNLS